MTPHTDIAVDCRCDHRTDLAGVIGEALCGISRRKPCRQRPQQLHGGHRDALARPGRPVQRHPDHAVVDDLDAPDSSNRNLGRIARISQIADVIRHGISPHYNLRGLSCDRFRFAERSMRTAAGDSHTGTHSFFVAPLREFCFDLDLYVNRVPPGFAIGTSIAAATTIQAPHAQPAGVPNPLLGRLVPSSSHHPSQLAAPRSRTSSRPAAQLRAGIGPVSDAGPRSFEFASRAA